MATKSYSLPAQKRDILGKKVKVLRQRGLMPAVIYGHDFKNMPITLETKSFQRVFKDAGSSALVNLEVEGEKPVTVLIHEPDLHPVTEEPMHADMYRVKMDEAIRTEIPLTLIGESSAVLELEGTLVQNLDNLEVETLPGNLIPEVEVDISRLKTFEDQIRVEDLKVPENIKVLTEPEEVVVLVTPPRSEEEMKELEEAPVVEAEAALTEELNKEPEAESSGGQADAENKEPEKE